MVASQKELTIPSNGNFSSMPSLRQFPFLTPKRVVLTVGGRSWHIRITWGENIFQTTYALPATIAPSCRFCYTLGTRGIFENISWLMAWASHLHRDFANHYPKSPSFYLRFSQLPLSGEGCQLGPHRPLGMAGNPTCRGSFPVLMVDH